MNDKTAHTLRELRGDRTQAEVAQAVGISQAALAMYESGERTPRDEIKIRIANYYGVSVLIFFDDASHVSSYLPQ